jgi:hypothetical protein
MKRGRNDSLTGGTRDVNPQFLSIHVTQTAADAATVIAQPLPIPRFPTAANRNLVMEFLYIDYYHINPVIPAAGTQASNLVTVTTSPTVYASVSAALQDTRLVDAWSKLTITSTLAGFIQMETEFSDELYDSAGHGILVATDFINIGVYSATTAVANEYILKIAYRWKEVTLAEYIGIVQSQQ